MSHQYTLKLSRLPDEKLKLGVVKAPVTRLPLIVDLRRRMPPVYNQGNLGSCTANVFVAAIQFQDPTFFGSRLFLYYNTNLIEGNVIIDDGATLADGISALEKYGVCSEAIWPYNIKKYATRPPGLCYTNGLKHRVLSATNIQTTTNSIKQALFRKTPIVCGIAVYSSFENASVTATGIVPMPGPNEHLLGGHAVLVVGYNETRKQWIMRNCWGPKWGDKGYFYLPYAYLLNPKYCMELWTLANVTRDI
jgi:C1A family cysteine protease